jgi:LysM repeat protein
MKKDGLEIVEPNLKYITVKYGWGLMNLNKNVKPFTHRINTLLTKRVWALIGLFFMLPFTLEATRRRPSFEEDYSILLREVLDNLDNLKNEVQIHESQIMTFEEKFKNLEEIIDSLRQQTTSTVQSVKDTLKNHASQLDVKLADQQNAAKGLSNDVKSFANENQQLLKDFRQRITELEKTMELQNQNIESLRTALSSVIEVIKGKETNSEKPESTTAETAKIYKVKAGDNLEKIAKQNQTTIKKLKEWNNLTSDQIIVGQKLKISEQ